MDEKEGLGFFRTILVINSFAPVFLLWAIRGINCIENKYLIPACIGLIVIPYAILFMRLHFAKKSNDTAQIVVDNYDNHKDQILVYLVAMLIPLYDANIGTARDVAATITALALIIFIFIHLNLHYVNIIFALKGYKVYTIQKASATISGDTPIILLSKKNSLKLGKTIIATRISNTVYIDDQTQ